jgi:very-short-patch-repair endonuclease
MAISDQRSSHRTKADRAEGSVAVDPAMREMVKQGILKAREKLVDLTLRNAMLNFRHSDTSTRHVRIVDQGVRFLEQKLASGDSLDFAPLPPVELIPPDEDTEVFRAAVKKAKAIDPEWLTAEDSRRAAGNRRRVRDKVAERALRDRVRAELDMPPWLAAIEPKARAKELGIEASFDLPNTATAGNKLQTLFFPERLEPKLSALHSAARALQEDAGISALHCALGFLEWYEADDSSDPAYAPLVLLPVNMEKRIVNGEYVFSLLGRDDDVTANVALREKLKRIYALELPEYDLEEGIEAYLKTVTSLLGNRPRWRVRRWATVGLFSFARQAMWSDLDPERWPASTRPEAHPLLGQIYGDVAATHSEIIAPIHDVDRPELESHAPALVTEADASQLSAVIDAAMGKNLVIQGPPGTGKSQTITNIIANALWHGQSVLFVSEKMAALKVVKDRLDHMGLGLFCLEVHSAKASKTFVLKAIRERMQCPRTLSNGQEVERARESLRKSRQRLTEYALLMNSSAGDTGLTTHQILWGDFTRATRPDAVPASALDFRFPVPLGIDRFKLGDLAVAGKALDDLSAAMGSDAEPKRQPWRGIGNINLNRFDRASAIPILSLWVDTLEQLQQRSKEFTARCGWHELETIAQIETAIGQAHAIPDPDSATAETILPLALEATSRQSLANWSELAKQADELNTQIDAICSRSAVATDQDFIAHLVTEARRLGVAEATAESIQRICAESRASSETITRIIELLHELFALAGRDVGAAFDVKSEAMGAGFLHVMGQLSSDDARFRSATLSDDSMVEDLAAAVALAADVKSAASEAKFAEEPNAALAQSIPSVSELRQAAGVFRGAGFFGKLIGSEWRRAKAVWRSTFVGERKPTSPQAARRLFSAALWKERFVQLEANVYVKSAAGRHWCSADTPFENLLRVATWMKLVRHVTPLAEAGARELRRIAFQGSAEDIARLYELVDRAAKLKLLALFEKCYTQKSNIVAAAQEQNARATALGGVQAAVQRFGLRPGVPIVAFSDALSVFRKIGECRQRMRAETVAVNALSTLTSGADIERAERIKITLNHADLILASRLPDAVAKWLLQRGCNERTANLKAMAQQISATIERHAAVVQDANKLLQLRFEEWCGGPWDVARLDGLIDKCRRAAHSPEALETQVALLSSELEATNLGLGGLIRHWNAAGVRYGGVAWAVEAAFYRSAAEKLMREHPILAQHTGNTHEQIRERFQKLDKEIIQLNRKMIAAKLQARPVPPGGRAPSVRDYTDNQMLDHQTGLQQPRIALRRLFTNAGGAIRAYMPCIMMSPMSVAQYLEAGKHTFDLLVVDEASQMRPEDALGALLRSKQAIIVGDPEQLPPTDFFVAADNATPQEVEDAPEESILELGRRCWHPMRMLDVHYRSRHHSLIAYSNREFYDERLLVYPSPVLDDPEFGVSCRRINGAYEPGQARNFDEAKAIVEEAAALMRQRTDRSIGIVAVNQAQRDLIETLMDELAASDPNIQAYRQVWDGQLEDFFIKNLENVQGDERDIILISTVYGRTADDVFHQNFGPINRAYGHRRLNVLFTRAKRRLTVFTSLDHAQIVADGKQRGVRVLKEFLEYATTGTITSGRKTGKEPDSDFERWFLSRLRSAGFDAHPQVGVAKYRIDIGIIHPEKPGTYILGVECDGATYHSSKSARDRDRLRQEVLEKLHWKIHRVWSTDWYRDPEREFNRLLQTIQRHRTAH